MASPSQARSLKNYRKRIKEKGLARFEVLAPVGDRELIRAVARRLTEDTANAMEIRGVLRGRIADKTNTKGGILKALRRSPLVGADLELGRATIAGRVVDL